MNLFGKQVINILSVDGGGIRGIVPALILAEMETMLEKKGSYRTFGQMFHLIAGTSIGGLITLGLAMPKPGMAEKPLLSAQDLFDLMRERGSDIFPPNQRNPASYLAQAVRRKYGDNSINNLLKEILGDLTLKDAVTNILISSYNTETREPCFFKKRPAHKEWLDDPDYYARDVARATIAAPTFFSPAYIAPIARPDKFSCLIDGGIFVNNPALAAYTEARKIYPRAKRFRILSLGTGSVDKPYHYQDVRNWGFINWMAAAPSPPLLDMMVDGQSDNVVHMLERLPGVEFHRIDFDLDEKHSAMDDIRPYNIKYLETAANKIIRKRRQELTGICDMLART